MTDVFSIQIWKLLISHPLVVSARRDDMTNRPEFNLSKCATRNRYKPMYNGEKNTSVSEYFGDLIKQKKRDLKCHGIELSRKARMSTRPA